MYSVNLFALNDGPQVFTLDGQLFVPGTTEPLLDASAVIDIQILDPSAKCVLYEEQQTIAPGSTNGFMNLQVGSAVGAAKRTGGDLGHAMALVYQNTAPIPAGNAFGQTCAGGVYTPAPGDVRYFRVTVTPSSTHVAGTLSPDMILDSVPNALVAQSLQGLERAGILQVNTSGSEVLSQPNLEALFTATNYTALTNLLSGASTQYVQSTSNGELLPVVTGAPTSLVAGQVWYDSGGHVVKFYNGSTTQTLGVAGSGVTSLSAGTGLTGGVITSTGSIGVDVGVTANKIVQLNGSGQLPAVSGALLTNLNATMIGTRSIASTAPTSGQILTWNASNSDWEPQASTAITALTGDVVATGPGSVSATIQPNAITSAKINSVYAINRLVMTDGMTGASLGYAACSGTQVLQWSASGWLCTNVSAMLGNSGVSAMTYGSATQVPQLTVDAQGRVTSASNLAITFPVTSVAGKTGVVALTAADISGLGTSSTKDVGTSPANVVQLDGLGKLPAVDGSQLTNLNTGRTFVNGGNTFAGVSTLGNQDAFALNLITNNQPRLTILAAGAVGIGTASPGEALDVATNANNVGVIHLQNNSASGYSSLDISDSSATGVGGFGYGNASTGVYANQVYYYSNNKNIVFSHTPVASHSDLTINGTSGNIGVGVGSTSPSAALMIKAGGTAAGTAPLKFTSGAKLTAAEDGAMEYDGSSYYLTIGSTRTAIPLTGGTGTFSSDTVGVGSASGPTLNFSGDTTTGFYNASAGAIGVSSAGTNAMTLSSTGIAGNSAFTLSAGGAAQNLTLTSSTTGAVKIGSGNGTSLSILDGGASTVDYVTIKGSPAGGSPTLATAGSDTNINFTITPKGTGNTIFSAGKVGIGTASPTQALDLGVGAMSSGNLIIAGNPTGFASPFTANGQTPPEFMYVDSTYGVFRIGSQGASGVANIAFELPSAGTYQDVMSLSTTGLVPASLLDNSIALGTSGQRWKSLWVGTGNGIFQGSVGVGTTSPGALLDVNGTANVKALTVGGTAQVIAWTTVTKSANYSLTTVDAHKLFLTSGTTTLTLPSPTSAGANFTVGFNNVGAGIVTISPNASETINNASSLTLPAGGSASLITDGTNWFFFSKNLPASSACATANLQVFSASGTWTKPTCGTQTLIECWGGGGGASSVGGGGGGGGGAYNSLTIATTSLGAMEAVTVGAGGATGSPGGTGGTSTFGSWLSAYGGGGGSGQNGGGGGGQTSAGGTATGSAGGAGGGPSGGAGATSSAAAGSSTYGGGGGGYAAAGKNNGSSTYGGGGGHGYNSSSQIGNSIYGGGGGTGWAGSCAGQSTSLKAKGGGCSAGSQPAAGGGTNAAGGAGACFVTTM